MNSIGWQIARAAATTCAIGAALIGTGAAPASAQEPIAISFNGMEIELAGRVHTQFTTTSVDGENPAEFLLRRVRFGVDVQVNDVVSGRIHPDYGRNGIGLGDAYMQIALSPALQIQAGRSHRPFGIMEQTTSLRIAPIERGVSIRGVDDYDLSRLISSLGYGDRDLGLRVVGDLPGSFAPRYLVGVYNGPVQDLAGGETTLQWVGRLEASPLDGIDVGVAYSHRDFVDGFGDVDGGGAFLADVEYGGPTPAPGIHLVAQASLGDFDPHTDRDFVGAQLWTSYLFPGSGVIEVIEPLIRVGTLGIDDLVGAPGRQGGVLFTPGFNFYLGGLNRVMVNYDIFSPEGDGDTESSFKVQFQVSF